MLAAMTREFLDAGLRVLVGSVLAVFFVGFALGGIILLPLVALVLTMAALPSRLRAAARQLRGSGSQIRAAARSLRHATLTTCTRALRWAMGSQSGAAGP
jgi:ABC-type multidrug transport system fused ATPase/permease subunit